jgi:hypothetical protein
MNEGKTEEYPSPAPEQIYRFELCIPLPQGERRRRNLAPDLGVGAIREVSPLPLRERDADRGIFSLRKCG